MVMSQQCSKLILIACLFDNVLILIKEILDMNYSLQEIPLFPWWGGLNEDLTRNVVHLL